jgi:hypothetical protein
METLSARAPSAAAAADDAEIRRGAPKLARRYSDNGRHDDLRYAGAGRDPGACERGPFAARRDAWTASLTRFRLPQRTAAARSSKLFGQGIVAHKAARCAPPNARRGPGASPGRALSGGLGKISPRSALSPPRRDAGPSLLALAWSCVRPLRRRCAAAPARQPRHGQPDTTLAFRFGNATHAPCASARARARRAAQNDVVKAINGDPFIGMFETPVTSSPLVRAAARERGAHCFARRLHGRRPGRLACAARWHAPG